MEQQLSKEKSRTGLVIIIVILGLIILGLVGVICYDKELIFTQKEADEEIKESNPKEEIKDNCDTSNDNYYTDGTYYYLTLYDEIIFKSFEDAHGQRELSVKSFSLLYNGGYEQVSLYGNYEINNNSITLNFPDIAYDSNYDNISSYVNAGIVMSDSNENSKLKLSKSGIFYSITLDYDKDKIMFGPLTLNKQN